MVERRVYQANWVREKRAERHGGVRWPRGRPRKDGEWPPKPGRLHCIFCTMFIDETYHLKNPCWKYKLSTIFAEKGKEDILSKEWQP